MHALDLAVLLGWLVLSVGVGLALGRQASPTLEGYLVADRRLPWWVVGTSMVATTFAADTPLVVAGYVATGGVLANWRWWWMGAAGIAGVYLFAPLWRRSGVLTDAELTELRYHGPAAAVLRGAKAVWFGVFMNLLTIAWVMGAMRKLVRTALDLPATVFGLPTDGAVVFGLFTLTVGYTTAAGLYGVVATDLLQFALAMGAAVGVAWLAWTHVGGLDGLDAGWAAHGLDLSTATQILPPLTGSADGPLAEWLVLMGITWWGSKQLDGGGYLAQRLFAAKDDHHATWAYLWFTFAHVCVRPWPWILTGLAGVALFGAVDDPETLYPRVMTAVLTPGWFGLVLASFLAAFMSTIDTQLHWGASLVTRDLWQRFVRPDASDAALVRTSRLSVLGLAAAGAVGSLFVEHLGGAWELAFAVTAGLGTVYAARWFWWRTTAVSELVAMAFAALATAGVHALAAAHPANGGSATWLADLPAAWLGFPYDTATIALVGLPVWVGLTLLTPPTPEAHLRAFAATVRTGGPGWAHLSDAPGPGRAHAVGMVAGMALVYGGLVVVGALLLAQPVLVGIAGLIAALGAVGTAWSLRQLVSPPSTSAPSSD